MSEKKPASTSNFIKTIIETDLKSDIFKERLWGGQPGPAPTHQSGTVDSATIRTRFPPEPNGYLHIGHAKSICLNFGLAAEHNGVCHLRFDDTNPATEDTEYVNSIRESVAWLGFNWNENEYFSSDYFQTLFDFANLLINEGLAYVDSLNAEEIRNYRGTLTEPGKDSPYRDRDTDENRRLFQEMRSGKHPDGSHVLRLKIDMASLFYQLT